MLPSVKKMGCILLFHINIFKQGSIRALCEDLGIDVRVITDGDLSRTMGQIAGISSTPDLHGGKPVPFSDEMMVFCGMSSDQLDRFLSEYRQREISPIPLKAVLTSVNAKWLPGRLCMELKKEQQSLSGRS